MMQRIENPLPVITSLDKQYWRYLRNHEFRLQRCGTCGTMRFPAAPCCAECGSTVYDWAISTGQGAVFSWVVFHKSYFKGFDDAIPYNVVMVQLDDGPMFIANIVGIDNEAITRGLRVKMVFDDVNDEITIPRFQPL